MRKTQQAMVFVKLFAQKVSSARAGQGKIPPTAQVRDCHCERSEVS
jgi:hypothetical protein